VIGFLGMIVAGLPFIAAGLPFRLVFPEDRFTLSFLPFIGIFWAGLIGLIPDKSNRFLIYGFVLMLAFNFQFQMMSTYRGDWKIQKNFAWQLAWRAPKLGPGTNLLSEDHDTFLFNDDEAFTPILNWMYVPAKTAQPYSYHYSFISLRMAENLPQALETVDPVNSKMLVIRYSPPACLHIFDPKYDNTVIGLSDRIDISALSKQKLPVVSQWITRAMPLSNPSQTLAGDYPATPPSLFGPEPEHGWCYFYLKADLARQIGAWDEVVMLGDEALIAKKLRPDDNYEFMPFIEGYARQGRLKDARLLTRQVAESDPFLRPALCSVWQRIAEASPDATDDFNAIRRELQVCPAN
jgi:hypothetical protein